MIEKKAIINAPSGLHSRPCAIICQYAKKHEQIIILQHNGKEANAKNMFKIMLLGVKQYNEVIIKVEGNDAEYVAGELADIITKIKE